MSRKQLRNNDSTEATTNQNQALTAVPEVTLLVAPRGKKPQRIVDATCGDVHHRDNIDTDSHQSRRRFFADFAKKLGCDVTALSAKYDAILLAEAEAADKTAAALADQVEEEFDDDADSRIGGGLAGIPYTATPGGKWRLHRHVRIRRRRAFSGCRFGRDRFVAFNFHCGDPGDDASA